MNAEALNERSTTALHAIKSAYGQRDGAPTLFVSHHLKELESEYWLRTTGVEQPNSDQILDSLVLIDSWSSEGDGIVNIFDFALPEHASGYVLSVRFDRDGHVDQVSMES